MKVDRSIILIGMPGAGKSTVGVVLAKTLAMPFVDSDMLIQERVGMSLQDFVDAQGYMALRAVEAEVLLEAKLNHSVVATGGSAVYSEQAMARLGSLGPRIYLKISLETLGKRVLNQKQRGIACAPGTSLADLFAERQALYENCADLTIAVDNLSFDQTMSKVLESL